MTIENKNLQLSRGFVALKNRNHLSVEQNIRDILTLSTSEPAMSYRDTLMKLLARKSLVRGRITLSSGSVSDYYFDCKLTTLDPEGAVLTGYAFLELLREQQITADAVGGLTMGADPIVSAIVVISQVQGKPLPGFLIRKERKGHGREKCVEGFEGAKGAKVVIVDEVCTTGGSIIEAIEIAQAERFDIVAVVSLVDREEGGSEKLKQNYNYHALFTANELLRENERFARTARDTSHTAESKTPIHR
ncbi:MAG TPA: orotate phosphoribosyltransferase [Acidobacteriota bacterium]